MSVILVLELFVTSQAQMISGNATSSPQKKEIMWPPQPCDCDLWCASGTHYAHVAIKCHNASLHPYQITLKYTSNRLKPDWRTVSDIQLCCYFETVRINSKFKSVYLLLTKIIHINLTNVQLIILENDRQPENLVSPSSGAGIRIMFKHSVTGLITHALWTSI